MAGNSSRRKRGGRRVYSDELKAEAVQMVLDGVTAYQDQGAAGGG